MSSHTAKRARLTERTMLACLACKQKKLKCDGQIPKCQTCAKTGRDCLVEDPATGLHRPRDYMQSLETRVAYLESLLQQVRPEVASDHFGREQDEQATSPVIHHAQDNAELVEHQTASSPMEENMDHLSAEVALLCLSAAGREPHYFGPSSAVSFSRIISATMGLSRGGDGSQQSIIGPGENPPSNRRTVVAMRFPPPSLGASLSQAYFNNIHPQYPFLHRPTFLKWESECMAASLAGSLDAAGDVAIFFVLMVYAIGSLAMGSGQHDAAEGYYSMALDRQQTVLDLDNIQSIQSILCCAIYSIRSPVGASLWKISGMAIRQCIELGYHRSAAKYRKNADVMTREMSKRCFWVAYDIDRVAAFILGRPVGIPDESIDTELPLDVEDDDITAAGFRRKPRSSAEEPPTQMTGFIHAIKLRRLWSKIGDLLYPSISRAGILAMNGTMRQSLVDSLGQELEDWHNSIPEPVDYSGSRPLSVFASKEWFQLAYDHSVLLLYRHDLNLPTQFIESGQADKVFEECYRRAREICLLYRRLYQSPTIQFTWGSLHILFLGGLTYLYCLWRSPRVRQSARRTDVMNTCMACNTVLVIIAERWSQATTYRDTFEALSERTISMICGDAQHPADWRSDAVPLLGQTPNLPDPVAHLQDWVTGLDDMWVPQESEWLVQDLLQGMREFQPEDVSFGETVLPP
ncbi:Fungal specific transcription factor [Pleurostoma richardsiae]|uniref:Fungal specific transcription factor n=1 Tax=Pleurostoma richardsiae TaxID=41990 RepID=A0AA38RU43_9PEZI|nr:Fungal specific transcription factor [Pleurostoma richardsiae]